MRNSAAALLVVPTLLASMSVAGERRVLIIGVDGLRPDCLAAAETPNIDRLIADGTYNDNAQCEALTFSGPNWSTILHGVHQDKHGVTTNGYIPSNLADWPDVFAYLERHNPDWVTARFNTWDAIYKFQPTGADVDRFHDYTDDGDEVMLASAVRMLLGDDSDAPGGPDAAFFYIADVDVAGHTYGFDPSRPEYLAEIEDADRQIGELMDAIASREAAPGEDWLIVLTSDHGGNIDGGHAGNTIERRTIPFLVSGPLAAKGSAFPEPKNVDTVATVLAYMGVPIDPAWGLDGRPVGLEVWEREPPALGINLIANPGADFDRPFEGGTPDQAISGWVDPGPDMMTTVRYGSEGGWPGEKTPGPRDRGRGFFSGGQAPLSEITQEIDLSPLAGEIRTGLAFTLSGWLGGFEIQGDHAILRVEFLDASGQTIGSGQIGPVMAADRNWETALVKRTASGSVPEQARSARVTLRSVRRAGPSSDGYADSLSLVLSRP